ncbi:MAG: site-2 protease family protein [Anaerolineales bacterium]|nr:site-2 protease family protein [Anaerolineales bacterium]
MFVWMIVAFVFILGPVMFLHEFGHFWAAKKSGIPVEEFGFGLGPKIKTFFVHDGTEYTLRAIPFAAYVLLQGEEKNIDQGLYNAPRKAKFLTFAAGPGLNIAATLVFLWVAYLFGPPAYTRVILNQVDNGSPADSAGLLPGDIVLKAGNVDIIDGTSLQDYTNANLGKEITLLVERENEELEIAVTPRTEGQYDPSIEGPLGVTMSFEDGPPAGQNIFKSGVSAIRDFGDIIKGTLSWPIRIIEILWSRATLGPDNPEVAASNEELRYMRPVGIYGILQLIAISLQTGITQGYWFYVFRTAGLISIALGMTNLLPIPALDGGRLFFIVLDWLAEKLFQHRINPEKEVLIHAVGLMIMLLVMFVITWQDIFNPLIQFPTPTPGP